MLTSQFWYLQKLSGYAAKDRNQGKERLEGEEG